MPEREFGSIEATIRAKVRPCSEEDLPALEWMGLYTRHRRIIRETFEAQKRGEALMLIAVAARFPVAQVWIDFARKRAQRVAVLWAVRTFYPLQRAGIGRQMLGAAERAAGRRGFHRAELELEEDNHAAFGFYRRLGWRTAGRDRHRRLIMIKDIKAL